MAEGLADELEHDSTEVDLYFRGKLLGHVAHSDEDIVDDARMSWLK